MENNDVLAYKQHRSQTNIYNSEQFKRENKKGFLRRNNTIQITAQNSER